MVFPIFDKKYWESLLDQVDKATLFSGDYYVLDVSNDEDAPVCICIAAVLDYWLYRKDKSKEKPLSYRFDVN